MKTHSSALGNALASVIGFTGEVSYFAQRSIGPVFDLVVRLWLAQTFFVSGVLKAADWDNALYLAANEYPVAWLNPVTAAYLGAAIELAGSLLLAVGLGTRFAALGLLALSLVIQFNYLALDLHLFWTVLLGHFVVRGAGPLSLDRVLGHGLNDTALPFAASVLGGFGWLSRYAGPAYQLFVRFWFALALIVAGAIQIKAAGVKPMWEQIPHIGQWLPLRSATGFAGALGLLGIVLALQLAAGLATRLSALILIGVALALQVMVSWHVDHAYWVAALGIVALFGPGWLSLDQVLHRQLARKFPQLEGKPVFSLEGLPRIVIIGAGFGGFACAAALRHARAAVTLIDRQNYHLFQPLLYQVATAGLAPGDIASTVRGMFREHFNTRVLLGEVTGVDTARKRVVLGARHVAYDYLVIATGAAHSYFGKDEWAPFAPGLKRVEDATEVRKRLLLAFERAENSEDPAEREALLTFLIVGGGPTGVELAGAIAELARFGMEKEFRRFDPAQARVVLVQSGARILPTFPEALSQDARTSLQKLGVEVILNSRVEHIDEQGVKVNGARIAARTVLWAAGVIASPAAKWLSAASDSAGRIKVNPDLSVDRCEDVFAIGDTVLSNAWNGQLVPGLAPAAKQGGQYVAKVLRARLEGRQAPSAFVYKHLGSLATIGRKSAVADFGFIRLRGALAWWFWGLVHVYFLVGVRNRLSVIFDWFWAYLTYRSGTRLITGGTETEASSAASTVPVSLLA